LGILNVYYYILLICNLKKEYIDYLFKQA